MLIHLRSFISFPGNIKADIALVRAEFEILNHLRSILLFLGIIIDPKLRSKNAFNERYIYL